MNLLQRLRDPSARRARFDPRDETTYVLVALMEALWIMPWLAMILPAAREMPFYLLVVYAGGNILVPLWLVRLLDGWGMWEGLRQVVFLCGLALVVLWTAGVLFPPAPSMAVVDPGDGLPHVVEPLVPPLVAILVWVGILWWRGLRIALVTPTPTRVAFGMRLGILSFFAIAALVVDVQAIVVAALPLFFFCGLLGISLARATSLRSVWRQPVAFGSRWITFMVLAAMAITLVGFLLAALLSGMDPALAQQVVGTILAIPVAILTILMTPLFLLLLGLLEALVTLIRESGVLERLSEAGDIAGQLQQGPPPDSNPLIDFLRQIGQLINALGGIQTCVTALVILVVVAVILLTLRRMQSERILEGEERENLESNALGGLRDLLRRGMEALSGALQTVGQFGLGRDLFAALTIRRIYAHMAALAAKRGYPRALSETPYEYRATLQGAYPTLDAEVHLITEAYVRVRYGELPETSETFRQVLSAWEGLKASEIPN